PSRHPSQAPGNVVEAGGGGERNVYRGPQGRDAPRAQESAQNARPDRRRNVITTPDLINSLVADATPVRRLRAPIVRAAIWLLFAAMILGLIVIGHGVRPDFAQKSKETVYVVGVIASLLTGLLAAIAAFTISLPDRSRWWLIVPAPTLVLWISTVSY